MPLSPGQHRTLPYDDFFDAVLMKEGFENTQPHHATRKVARDGSRITGWKQSFFCQHPRDGECKIAAFSHCCSPGWNRHALTQESFLQAGQDRFKRCVGHAFFVSFESAG